MSVDKVEIVLETSGTEGVPKKVGLSVDTLCASAHMGRELEDLQPGDCWLNCLPLNHVGGLSIKYRCEEAGATMLPHDGFDPEKIYGDMRQHAVTHISLVPVMLSKLLDHFGGEPAPKSLKTVLIGGDRLSKALALRAVGMGWPVVVSYGMTETASRITMLRLTSDSVEQWDGTDVGPPLAGVSITTGRQGEVRIKSYLLLGGEELVTGDLGSLDDSGHLHLYGRLDERIISGGVTVDPVQVEQQLMSAPGVVDMAISSIPDAEWGERIVVVVEGGGDREQLAEWVRENISSAMRPREFLFVDQLARNSLGKLDRLQLRAQAESALSMP